MGFDATRKGRGRVVYPVGEALTEPCFAVSLHRHGLTYSVR